MLFQPTNIYPDLKGSLGNGCIDATADLPVSWQLNGDSAMVAYQITIYQNDAASTQMYTTGKVTVSPGFSPADRLGNPQRYTATITAATLSTAGITNGNDYKLIIKQWWGATNTESVTQTSAAAFVTRAAPVLTLTVPATIAAKEYTFTASYSQAQGDALNWVRWRIAYASETDTPFYDSGETSTSVLETAYDGFFTGQSYSICLDVETANGVLASSGWVDFDVSYATSIFDGIATAKCDSYGAVNIEWTHAYYSDADSSSKGYSIADGEVTIQGSGNFVKWDEINGSAMSNTIVTPWSIIWHGRPVSTLPGYNYAPVNDINTIMTIKMAGNYTYMLDYTVSTNTIRMRRIGGLTQTITFPGCIYDAPWWVIITPTTLYIRIEGYDFYIGTVPSPDLYTSPDVVPGPWRVPDEALYPDDTLLPFDAIQLADTLQYTGSLANMGQSAIEYIQLGHDQICDYIQVISGEPTQAIIDAVYNNGSYTPSWQDVTVQTYFLADFDDGSLNGGNIHSATPITGFAIYRQQGNGTVLKHIADAPISTTQLWDFSTQSRQGPYSYYLFPESTSAYITDPLVTNSVNPCLQAWFIYSAIPDSTDKNVYEVQRAFAFALNLNAGNVSNNNAPSVLPNFTRYPTVQMATPDYQSGSLSSLIGAVEFDANGRYLYQNTKVMRDAIWALSTTTNALFLKSMEGDFLEIRVSGAINKSVLNDLRLATTMSVPWVEIADTQAVSLVAYTDDIGNS